MATGAAIVSGLALAYGAYSGERSYQQAKEAEAKQERAIADAEAKQKEADEKAETKRLEALARAEGGDTGRTGKFDFGIDSVAAKATSPATIATSTTDEEENPFYARGML